jgi:protein-tyrosine phosphatase
MIDLHNHLLPEIDDGPDNWKQTFRMCQIAAQDGITHIVATPHISLESHISGDVIQKKVKQLNDVLKIKGLGLEIVPAADVALDPNVFALLERNELLTIGGKNRYMLLEIPPFAIPPYIGRFIFELQTKGVIPIITHPERNMVIQQDPDLLKDLVQKGALVQVTAMSLTNGFGSQSRNCIRQLLRSDLVHLMATDAHSVTARPPLLSPAVEAAAQIVGWAQAEAMVTTHPLAILEGERLI